MDILSLIYELYSKWCCSIFFGSNIKCKFLQTSDMILRMLVNKYGNFWKSRPHCIDSISIQFLYIHNYSNEYNGMQQNNNRNRLMSDELLMILFSFWASSKDWVACNPRSCISGIYGNFELSYCSHRGALEYNGAARQMYQ